MPDFLFAGLVTSSLFSCHRNRFFGFESFSFTGHRLHICASEVMLFTFFIQMDGNVCATQQVGDISIVRLDYHPNLGV